MPAVEKRIHGRVATVPTFRERGATRLASTSVVRALVGAPKNAPAGIIEKLNEAINAYLADPKIKPALPTSA